MFSSIRWHALPVLLTSIPLLYAGLPASTAYAKLLCIAQTTQPQCTALPTIRSAILQLSESKFELQAQYEACHSIRHVHITGRALQTVSVDNIMEYELLGETFQPVTDFVPFPRTIGYLVLDSTSGQGQFTDSWSAQRLPRYAHPELLTVPMRCRK